MAEGQPAETEAEAGAGIGTFAPGPARSALAPGDIVAAVISVLWLALVCGVLLFGGGAGGGSGGIVLMVAIFMPIALIWTAANTARAAREMRTEARRMQAAVDAMRSAYLNQAHAGSRSLVEKRLDEIAASTRQAESAILSFTQRRDGEPPPQAAARKAALSHPAPPGPSSEQPALALGTPSEPEPPPVTVTDFVRALNFPDNANDREGFRALKRALGDRSLAKLIRAAQDALTLLSQDGIYMDDLRPDRTRPEIWRRFAQGERSRETATLGGVRDRSSLALTAARMRQDTIFRDTAHHFLRQFDKTFQEFENNASDEEIAALSETRTARAFMLLGRVTGIFD